VFNWNSTQSFQDYAIYSRLAAKAVVLFSSDDLDTGGHGRVYHQSYDI
jgi:hypothetical protein